MRRAVLAQISDIPVTNRYRYRALTVRCCIPHRMTTGQSSIDDARWDELARTAALVRASADDLVTPRRSWRRIATSAAYLVVLGGVTVAALHAVGDATPVRADGAADGALFSLTNQDRASNGIRSLGGNGTLVASVRAAATTAAVSQSTGARST